LPRTAGETESGRVYAFAALTVRKFQYGVQNHRRKPEPSHTRHAFGGRLLNDENISKII